MQKAKSYNSETGPSAAEVLEQLAKEAESERQAIGYPEHHGKICYSSEVRNLAIQALGQGFSLAIVATASKVTGHTLRNWFNKKQSAPFRELKIVSSKIEEQDGNYLDERSKLQEREFGPLEFVLPSGVRVLVNRRDLDASLFAMFMGNRGV